MLLKRWKLLSVKIAAACKCNCVPVRRPILSANLSNIGRATYNASIGRIRVFRLTTTKLTSSVRHIEDLNLVIKFPCHHYCIGLVRCKGYRVVHVQDDNVICESLVVNSFGKSCIMFQKIGPDTNGTDT